MSDELRDAVQEHLDVEDIWGAQRVILDHLNRGMDSLWQIQRTVWPVDELEPCARTAPGVSTVETGDAASRRALLSAWEAGWEAHKAFVECTAPADGTD